ncbi:DUF3127 domain-containing protein [Haloferula sp. A504]|uniref:DUF3127 domain-containing protein n=1 Tax=Haloferula sp. A504 TaxID=3373601 RepID=UPI0031CB5E57|nr:DUF3127 domain-containing protein [Verrucomicrobiaceae bacterium E54]
MAYELEGTVHKIFDTQTFASGFSKREFVVEVPDGNYTQQIKLEAVKDKAALLDDVSEGDQVKVTFDLRGNEYKERFYVNLVAWKLEKSGDGGGGSGGAPSSSLDAALDNEPDESDDIPF